MWLTLHPVPSARPHQPLTGVERVYTVSFAIAANSVRYLPARSGIQLDFDKADESSLRTALAQLPEPFMTRVEPTSRGLRAVIVHPTTSGLRALTRTHSGQFEVTLGTRSEDLRMRVLATIVRQPLPQPRDLGAHLELWLDAEQATANGELRTAARLWSKLEQTSHLDDLAGLRIAELYLVSGHLNEAQARFRSISRQFPRSTGAALARLDLLHVQAITDEQPPPTLEHIEMAAEAVDREQFEPYAWTRAALVLNELGLSTAAVAHLPESDTLPAAWQPLAARLREQLLERAIATPIVRGDAMSTVVAWEGWAEQLDEHPDRSDIVDAVLEAYSRLGMFARSVPLLRARLRELPEPRDEGVLIARLAEAYHGLQDPVRLEEVLEYAIVQHPALPGLDARIRGLAMMHLRKDGLDAALSTLNRLKKTTKSVDLKRRIDALKTDLVLGHGDPIIQVKVLNELRQIGFDNASIRAPALALALARMKRAKDAAPLLREWIGKTMDSQSRDRLAYHLAMSEIDLGHDTDAERILRALSHSGTHYGLIAKLALRERTLERVLGTKPEGT